MRFVLLILSLLICHGFLLVKKPQIVNTAENVSDKAFITDVYKFNDSTIIGRQLKRIAEKMAKGVVTRPSYYWFRIDSVSGMDIISRPRSADIYSFIIDLEQSSRQNSICVHPCLLWDSPFMDKDGFYGVVILSIDDDVCVDFFIRNCKYDDTLVKCLFVTSSDKVKFEKEVFNFGPNFHAGYSDLLDMYVGCVVGDSLETQCFVLENKIVINKIPGMGPVR